MRKNISPCKRERRRGRLPFYPQVFQFYLLPKAFLACLNEQVKYSLSDNPNLNEFTTLFI